ncbi:Phosphopantetheine adenylyltransferase [Astathelohania contejeani]|uniref:Phosphopantetheine adenylyltransferase n=1 Tax=Astathelohania contejeani TaxID=164912 RepID=A0ABQ7HY08_9MICR|nr:Phosphopantetheine adenylyltransferase [Thelohania contejeani]
METINFCINIKVESEKILLKVLEECIRTNLNIDIIIEFTVSKIPYIHIIYKLIYLFKLEMNSTSRIRIFFSDEINDIDRNEIKSWNEIKQIRSNIDIDNDAEEGKLERLLALIRLKTMKYYDADIKEKYINTIIGGTFDHMHEGHYVLISIALLLSEKVINIGLTTSVLHSSKKLNDKIQDYETRYENIKTFVKKFKKIELIINPLNDRFGCAIDPGYDCIFISKETFSGAIIINEIREIRGLPKLMVVVTPMLSNDKNRLSSTQIRMRIENKQI